MPKMSPPMSWVPSCRHKSNCWLAMKLGIWPKRREKIFKCSKSNSNLWSTCLEEKLGRVNHFYPSWRQFMDIPFAVLRTNVCLYSKTISPLWPISLFSWFYHLQDQICIEAEVEIHPDLRHFNIKESIISFDQGLQSYADPSLWCRVAIVESDLQTKRQSPLEARICRWFSFSIAFRFYWPCFPVKNGGWGRQVSQGPLDPQPGN